jgi:hypothetical protein
VRLSSFKIIGLSPCGIRQTNSGEVDQSNLVIGEPVQKPLCHLCSVVDLFIVVIVFTYRMILSLSLFK